MFDNIISELATMAKTNPEFSELHKHYCLSLLHNYICNFLLNDINCPVVVSHIKDSHTVEVKQKGDIESVPCDFDFKMEDLKKHFSENTKLKFWSLSDSVMIESMVISFK